MTYMVLGVTINRKLPAKIYHFMAEKERVTNVCTFLEIWISANREKILKENLNLESQELKPRKSSHLFKDAVKALKNHITPNIIKKPVQFADEGTGVLIGESKLLNEEDFKKLRYCLPFRFRDLNWIRIFTTAVHGTSMTTFYSKLNGVGSTIMLIQDTNGYVFGGYASEEWEKKKTFFGTGECFVFSIRPKFAYYPWTRYNDYFMYASNEGLAMGSGENGRFAFYIDSEFEYGTSEISITYLNKRLSCVEEFSCILLEVWALTYKSAPNF